MDAGRAFIKRKASEKMDFKCKVSIITVSYNSVSTIEQTIKSVLHQSYENIEYIIIDGNSTDGTQQIIEKYRDSLAYYISEKDDGLYYAMNRGIKQATGDIVGIINSDDWYADNIIKDVADFFEKSDAEIIYGKVISVSDKQIERQKAPLEMIWYQMPMPHPAVFVKKNVYDKYGVFNVKYRVSADYDLMLRLFYQNVRFRYFDKVCAYFREGGISTTHAKECREDVYKISMSHLDKCPNGNTVLPKIRKRYRIAELADMLSNDGAAFFRLLCGIFHMDISNIIIFGTGVWGERCRKALEGLGVTVSYFSDNDPLKWNTELEGIKVIEPEKLSRMTAYVLIAVREYGREIEKQLSDMDNEGLKYISIDEIVNTERYIKLPSLEVN